MADGTGVPSRRGSRIAGLDRLRGAALCGMVVYHLAWDLSALGWAVRDPGRSAAWTAFGDLVAGLFLGLSGAGLALARPKGAIFALRRLVLLAAAALTVSGASLWFSPEAPILFGILQCIAVTNALALAALGLHPAIRLGLAALAALAPTLLASPRFDGWIGEAAGLSVALPRALDYRPVLPWLAVVLVGTLAGQGLAVRRSSPPSITAAGPVRESLAWAGRHSLVLYLVHQPVLYGAVLLAGLAVGPPSETSDPFDRQCRADCREAGAESRLCAVACACATRSLAADSRSGGERLTPRHLDDVETACRRDSR